MDIPFGLRLLRKIELFQVVKKLDNQFNLQMEEHNKTVPLWEGEKKVLYWTYKWHKHIGSPIEDHRLDDMGFSNAEKKALGLKQMFGNLVSRGFATFYPAYTFKEYNKLESAIFPEAVVSFESNDEKIVFRVPSDQQSADGVLITSEGLLMGELLNNLYEMKDVKDIKFIDTILDQGQIDKKYVEITKAEQILRKRYWVWKFYEAIIGLSLVALIVLAFYIIDEAISILIKTGTLGKVFFGL